MTRLHSINPDSRLYTLKEGDGYSCLGFDVLESRTSAYARHLTQHGIPVPFDRPAAIGTEERFQQYEATARAFMLAPAPQDTWFDDRTPQAVRHALEHARRTGQRVRLFYGDTETGKAWEDEWNVVGTIGRSMGPCKIPLLIANARSHGGAAVLDSSVVAIASGPNQWLYRHENFDVGQWEIRPSDMPEYAAAVWHDGKLQSRHKTEAAAVRYVAFMRGERMAK